MEIIKGIIVIVILTGIAVSAAIKVIEIDKKLREIERDIMRIDSDVNRNTAYRHRTESQHPSYDWVHRAIITQIKKKVMDPIQFELEKSKYELEKELEELNKK